jgi:CDP-glucose 4,6-dehydratase
MVTAPGFWRGRRVFLTGHTGFKGAWASLILSWLKAEVYGFALAPEHESGLFQAAGVERDVHHRLGDVRDLAGLRSALEEARPSVVVHMAAQSLVRPSYAEPVATYATNVMGTVHLLEAVRQAPGVEAVVVVTSDKCYEIEDGARRHRETDRLGGRDPYSNSKGCAELVTSAYRRSFFTPPGAARVASVRAGNVIGGGDFARDRLVPDAMRAFMRDEPLRIRNPGAVRPWQHVIDPVLAYLTLAERLVLDGEAFAEEWNFGPAAESEVPVATVVESFIRAWGGGARWERDGCEHPHEAAYLRLDCSKASQRLGWRPLTDLDAAVRLTAEWYRALSEGADMRAVTLSQIERTIGARRAASDAA